MDAAKLPSAVVVVLALVAAQVILPATLDLVASVVIAGGSGLIGYRVALRRGTP